MYQTRHAHNVISFAHPTQSMNIPTAQVIVSLTRFVRSVVHAATHRVACILWPAQWTVIVCARESAALFGVAYQAHFHCTAADADAVAGIRINACIFAHQLVSWRARNYSDVATRACEGV